MATTAKEGSHIIRRDGQANPICPLLSHKTRTRNHSSHICHFANCTYARHVWGTLQQQCPSIYLQQLDNTLTKCNLHTLEFMGRKVHKGIRQQNFQPSTTTSNHPIGHHRPQSCTHYEAKIWNMNPQHQSVGETIYCCPCNSLFLFLLICDLALLADPL
jgi:hypothetical protein